MNPVTCPKCGQTMPEKVADDPHLHECARLWNLGERDDD